MRSIIIKNIIILCLVTVAHTAYPQWGISGGINLSTQRSRIPAKWENTFKGGFHIGVMYDLRLSDKFNFQPSFMLLNENSSRLVPPDPGDTNEYSDEFNSYGLFIPLVFSYIIPTLQEQNLLIEAGLYSAFGLWGEYKETKSSVETKSKLYPDEHGRFDFGLVTGVGYNINNMNYSLRLKQGYKRLGYNQDRVTTFVLSVGYKFK